MIDFQRYYGKLARKEAISEDEILNLLSELRRMNEVAAYLADCHAATLEGLPKSASKSATNRLVSICARAADMLQGGSEPHSGMRDSTGMVESAMRRCAQASEDRKAKGA